MSSLPTAYVKFGMVAPQNAAHGDWMLRLYHYEVLVSMPSLAETIEREVSWGRASSDGFATEARDVEMGPCERR